MKNVCTFILTLLMGAGVATQAAACTKPEAPVLPDPNTAVTPEMVKAKNDVKEYLAKAEQYLSCINNVSKHNAMVDEMKLTADSFNSVVRVYKERMGSA